jgi:hypothetical protein
VTQCQCSQGYHGPPGACIADACNQCYNEASCTLRNGFPICTAYFIPATMITISGFTVDSDGNWMLSNTSGGQMLQFDVELVNTPLVKSVGYVFSLSLSAPVVPCASYQIMNTSVTSTNSSRVSIQCTIGAGSGIDMVMVITVCHIDNVTCISVRDTNATFSWPAPTITAETLHFPSIGVKAATQTLKNTAATDIAFEGTNFYGPGIALPHSYWHK